MIRRKQVDNSIEQKILTGLIVSDKFIRDIQQAIKPEYFLIPYAQRISRWVIDYHKQYHKAPQSHIEDLFNTEKSKLKEEEADLISTFLSKLSNQYEEETNFNADYLYDKTIEYFKKRSLKLISEKVNGLVDLDKTLDAEKEIQKYREVYKQTSGWINPFAESTVKKYFQDEANNANLLFQLPGALGELVGPFERSWLFGILAPMKRGKCVAEGTKIIVKDGTLKNIEDVVIGDLVFSLNRENKLITNKVADILVQGKKKVYKIKTRTGREIELTDNHPLLTVEGWMKVKDIDAGNFIAVPKIIKINQELEEEDYKLRLLAYLLADGGVTGGCATYTKHNKYMLDDFIECIKKMGDKTSYIKNNLNSVRVSKSDYGYVGDNRSNKTNIWLESLGMSGVKSINKKIPEFVFKLNNHSISIFLSALFSGDGSIYGDNKSFCIEYGSASKELAYGVHHLLLRFGIVSKISEKINKDDYHGWGVTIRDKKNLLIYCNEIGFLPGSKKDRMESYIDKITNSKDGRGFLDSIPYSFISSQMDKDIKNFLYYHPDKGKYSGPIGNYTQSVLLKGNVSRDKFKDLGDFIGSDKPKRFLESDLLWDEVIYKEYSGTKNTYDLSLSKYHNFIANDIVVHNSFMLQELAIQALMEKLRVAYFSLEMDQFRIERRIYRRITATTNISGDFIYPCFDCRKNQLDACNKANRKNHLKLIIGEAKPQYDPNARYRPCTECRGTKDFELETWYTTINRDKMKRKNVLSTARGLMDLYGDNLRLKSYPAFSANLTRIRYDLDELEYTEDFVPDVICIDYADILAPEDTRVTGRERSDETWKTLKNLADSKHCLVVTASQSNRGSIDKKNVTQTDIAEDIRKIAHVDGMMALNQLPEEKKAGVMRISVIAERDEDFDQFKTCTVLQNVKLGQTFLDSELGFVNTNKKEKGEKDKE